MEKNKYKKIEKYMLKIMNTSAHDIEHIYRVLFVALEIAKHEKDVNYDVLITACLLHDIGREQQKQKPDLCHAEQGGIMAYDFLIKNKYDETFANKVQKAITQHRFRKANKPDSIEAKILFDSDKIDIMGCLGVCRTLLYQGEMNIPLYVREKGNFQIDFETQSFVKEYHFKLKNLSSKMYTKYGKKIAKRRQKILINFYKNFINEIEKPFKNGNDMLNKILK